MKIQHLAIIFVIIMLPVSIVVGYYINAQIDTITLQTEYDNKLLTATYDAIKSFQLNTINNKYSTISDSKIRDIEASISSFYNSLGTELGATGYSAEELKEFIPAIVYTMYDGYYIYGEYYNDIIADYQYSLKPYVYYSCRYKKGNNDFVVNYTLDNTITIYGIVNGEYVAKTGTLINPNNVSDIRVEENGNAISLTYRGVTIEREILTEQLITLDENSNAIREEYEYTIYNNRKIYKDNAGYFWNNNNKKQYISDSDTLRYIDIMMVGGHLYCNSAAQYYKNAYEFSTWVNSNIGNITQADAIDSNGNKINDFSVDTGSEKIFLLDNDNDPEEQGSTFQENRISVIRRTIVSNLSTAIANFNTSANTYEFVMPVFNEEDWDKITSNIAVTTFMQGIPIGSKYYNNYCIITNDKNKEFISKDSIYVITEDGQVHLPTCKKLLEENKKVVQAYSNVDFERQSVVADETREFYFYPHANERCYYCMVDSEQAYDVDNLIQGEVKQYNKNNDEYEIDTVATNKLNTTNVRKDYLTALARKRYELYRNIEAENRKYTYRVKPVILSVNPSPISVIIRAVGEVNDIVGYAVTENNVPPTNFTACKSQQNLTVTVGGLTPNKTYYAWVKDDEGNISDSKEFTTKEIGDIIFTVTPSTWTNQSVIVTATLTKADMALQTSKDGGITWQDTASLSFEQNGTMWARVRDYTSKIASIQITNIDKQAPIITKVDTTTNSATVTATDQNGSGINGYAITETNVKPTNGFQESNVFENLKQNTTYYVWVKDAVGNVSESKEFKTAQVTASSGNISFTLSPNSWTNGSVTVTAVTNISGFTLETSKNATTWEKQSTQVLDTNGIVYARLVDSTGQYNGIASIQVTIIDKVKPVITGVNPQTNSVTITATDEASGIIGYIVTESASEPNNFNMLTSSTKEMNINVTGLRDNTTYYVWVKDAAGNVSQSKQFITPRATREVTYIYDGNSQTRSVLPGSNVLSPGFTPSKSDCTFLGWTNNQSSATPLSSLTMGDSDITLWAVWKAYDKNITAYQNGEYKGVGWLSSEPKDFLAFNEVVDTSLYSGVFIDVSIDPNNPNASWGLYQNAGSMFRGEGYIFSVYVSDGTTFNMSYMHRAWFSDWQGDYPIDDYGTYNGLQCTLNGNLLHMSNNSFIVNFQTNNTSSARIYWRMSIMSGSSNQEAHDVSIFTLVRQCYLIGRQFVK